MNSDNARIIVIDDDESMRQSMVLLLHSMGYEVETYSSAKAFLENGRKDGRGCIVLDVKMPGMSGMELQDRLGKAEYHMPIVFVTGHGDLPMGVQAMKKGAVDFLAKPFEPEDLKRAIDSAIEKSICAKNRHDQIREYRSRIDRLSPREYEVFRHIVSGVLNKQIAAALDIAEQTVKIHRGRIMKKLEAASLVDLVRIADTLGVEPIDSRGPE